MSTSPEDEQEFDRWLTKYAAEREKEIVARHAKSHGVPSTTVCLGSSQLAAIIEAAYRDGYNQGKEDAS